MESTNNATFANIQVSNTNNVKLETIADFKIKGQDKTLKEVLSEKGFIFGNPNDLFDSSSYNSGSMKWVRSPFQKSKVKLNGLYLEKFNQTGEIHKDVSEIKITDDISGFHTGAKQGYLIISKSKLQSMLKKVETVETKKIESQNNETVKNEVPAVEQNKQSKKK